MSFKNSGYNFAYVSELENQNWSLGIDIPLRGDQLLHINWNDARKGKVNVSGSFYDLLLKELKTTANSSSQKWYLNQAFLALGEFIAQAKGSSNLSVFEIETKDQHLYFKKSITQSQFIVIDLFDHNGHYFQRMKLALSSKKKSRPESHHQVQLDLFVKQCSI